MAKRCLDKPNIHRLFELVYTTLPMVGHVSRLGDFVLEKAHQALKRAISHSNHKDVQLFAMSSIIFNDWEARLNMHVKDALQGKIRELVACFRLLAGREDFSSLNAQIGETNIRNVIKALSPAACVPAFLDSRGRSLISPRAITYISHTLNWKLTEKLAALHPHERSGCTREQVISHLKHAYRFLETLKPQLFGQKCTAKSKNWTTVRSLGVGDTVEILCLNPHDVEFHTPFLITRESIECSRRACYEGSSILVLIALFCESISNTRGDMKPWAALRPCIQVPGAKPKDGFDRFNTKYFVGDAICLTRVGEHMRPVAIMHDYDPALCSFVDSRGLITNSTSTLQEGAFFYPRTPRQG